MTEEFTFIEDVTPEASDIILRVRVVRLWKTTAYKNPKEPISVEMLFMDTKMGKIHASTKMRFFTKFHSHLLEGNCIVVRNFNVALSNASYKVASHRYKIIFQPSTSVETCEEINQIPRYGLELVLFPDIHSGTLDSDLLIDVIGRVSEVGPVQLLERYGKEKKMVVLELTDHENRSLQCTLWESYADDAVDFLSKNNDGHVYVIILFAQVKQYNRVFSISNTLFSTRVLFNAQFEEAISFISRLKQHAVNCKRNFSQMLSSQSSGSKNEMFLNKEEKKNLAEILDSSEPLRCTTYATIEGLESVNGWSYFACKKCNRKVKDDEIQLTDGRGSNCSNFFCNICGKSYGSEFLVTRFKLEIKVIDATANAVFVLFDRDVANMIHKSALIVTLLT